MLLVFNHGCFIADFPDLRPLNSKEDPLTSLESGAPKQPVSMVTLDVPILKLAQFKPPVLTY